MASKIYRKYGKYALLVGGAGLSTYAVFRLIDQKKEVHFRKAKTKLKLRSFESEVSLKYFCIFQSFLVRASKQTTPFLKPIGNKGLPSRADHLKSLRETKEFDVLVIGGGATGCGVALDSVTRGYNH